MDAVFTVSLAAVVVAAPLAFVNTARYKLPFWLAPAGKVSVGEVPPETTLW